MQSKVTGASATPTGSLTSASGMAEWRVALAPYTRPRLARSLLDILTAPVAYLAMTVLIYLSISISPALALLLALPAAGFLLRTYIVFHDCAHASFFKSRRANNWVGSICALMVLTPFARWRHDHAIHHANAGDLDRRGVGDLPTLTVDEYHAKTSKGRLAYRLTRNPLIMFGIGPIIAMIIGPRIFTRAQRPRLRHSVILTDIALAAVIASAIYFVGFGDFLISWAPAALLAGSAGIFMFYVQHQFEDVYWERHGTWNYADAALRGSSYLKLPKILQFFSGNIGLHHVHHMSAKIPNYNLQQAHEGIGAFQQVPVLTLGDGFRSVRLKLWDEAAGRLVTFAEAA